MVIAILEMLVFLHTYNVMADAAKEVVRHAIVHGASNPQGHRRHVPGSIRAGSTRWNRSRVQQQLRGRKNLRANVSARCHGLTVTATYPDGAAATSNKTANRVQVTVSYPYQPFFRLGLADRNGQRSRRAKDYELKKCCALTRSGGFAG
jgi:hypothetical protein